ncbi:MAG: ATP-binding protein [Candidatus Omnitrophica bacterium]|nr:ATP-binding protein [Candidatus Omnitrophota bacterium]
MERYLYSHIKADLVKKMVFITGPRQVGKTYLAKQIMREYRNPIYLNYDNSNDAIVIQKRQWPLSADLVIFDEVHKMKKWKIFLKGTFDTKPPHLAILVTGSARLDTFRQTGDSLAGRYFHYRLYPLTVKEVCGKNAAAQDVLNRLMNVGGFPEPYLAEDVSDSQRWRNQYYTDLVREDIVDFSRIHEVRVIRVLLELLRSRVGSPLSYRGLAEDLQIAPNTVRKYISILESLYIIFLVRPFHKNIARAITKEPKVYFFDTGYVKGDDGIRFENMVAVSLLKNAHYHCDANGEVQELNYLRDKEGREIDFVIARDGCIQKAIEVKLNDTTPSKNLHYFKQKYPDFLYNQVVFNLRQAREINGIHVEPAAKWLMNFSV